MPKEDHFFMKKQVAEFNTSQDTLRQIAQMEWNVDEMFRAVYSGGINNDDAPLIQNLYHYLTFIYADRLYAFAYVDIADQMQTMEDKLVELYEDWMKNHKDQIPTTLIKKLRNYKKYLYYLKQQKFRLGIPMRAETNADERMEKAAGV